MEGTTGERPTTFAQAFAASESAAATESPTVTPSADATPAVSTSADATVPPADSAQSEGTTPAQGPIPYERHDAILKGAYRERDTYKQQLDALSWAQNADRAAIQEAERLGQLFQRDRAGYIRSLLDEAMNDADLSPVLRSEFGRRLGQRTQADAEMEPDVPVFNEQGQEVTRTYSADRMKHVVQRAIQEAIGKEVGPIKQTFAQQEAARKHAAEQQQLTERVDSIYARLEKRPLFKEHEKDIAAAMNLPEFADLDPIEQAYAAYHHIVDSKLAASHEAKALETLKTKAAAATGSVNPAGAAIASTKRPTSFHDPALTW